MNRARIMVTGISKKVRIALRPRITATINETSAAWLPYVDLESELNQRFKP